jgi:hypothetical protein
MTDTNIDPIKSIKKQNDTSAGNLLDSMPVKVEQTEIDLSILENLPAEHPRLLIQSKDLQAFRDEISHNPSYCKFDDFIENSTCKYINEVPYREPKPYPEETVGKASLWRPYWRTMYVDCQMAFNAARNLSLAGIILQDETILIKAKDWVLKLASYNPKGVTSRGYNDEAAFRVIASLAWGYDWLYNEFTDEEKELVKEVLIIRLEEIMHHLKVEIDLFANPLNSHGVRSISSAIVPASIALYGEYPEAKKYLQYSLEYYAVHYPPWGGDDGAWAEGPDYWNTAMAFLGESFDLIKSYTSINMFNKKFYENTGDFILYCMPVHSKRASFCDQSSLGDYPGLKLAYNMRHFAGVNNKPEYIWYYNQLKARDTEANTKFYNYGWWDFGYDDFRFEYLWNDMTEKAPADKPFLKVFPRTGWAAFHSNMTDRDKHIHMIFKCSPFGSISHSHGDQNAFTLHAYGETLASITGYYIGFGVDMHIKWRRQTHSKNLPIFDGKGQYAENRSSGFKEHSDHFCVEAGGHITSYDSEGEIPYVEGDATDSYRFFNPEMQSYKRKIWFVKGKVFVMRDHALLNTEQDLTWLLHSTFKTETSERSFTIAGEKARLDVEFLGDCRNEILSVSTVEGFGDVDPYEYKDLEIHRHVETKFRAKKEHQIVTLLVPRKLDVPGFTVDHKIIKNVLELTIDSDTIHIDL